MDARRRAALGLAFLLGEIVHPSRVPTSKMDVKEIWACSDRALGDLLGLGPADRGRLSRFRGRFTAPPAAAALEGKGITAVALGEPRYPQLLAQIYDPPPALFLTGGALSHLKEFMGRRRIAIVGARSASGYGIDAATRLAEGLSREGVCIVSGLAWGIDSAAHRGAIAEEGGSIAVLGCGVDVIYPRNNSLLYNRMLKSGMIVSEYPPGTEPRPWRFPARNRIIAGLSEATVVVEARQKSGALITADFSLEQGREVGAVPGSIFSELSDGPHGLIRAGAQVVTCPDDLFECLGIAGSTGGQASKRAPTGVTGDEQLVYASLEARYQHLDALAAQAGLNPAAAALALVSLEIKSLARHDPGRGYAR